MSENVENIENVETNESAPEAENALDTLEAAVNAIVDEHALIEDNNGSAANDEAEKALRDMGARLDTLESENQRLTALIGKMVTAYGARLSDANSNNGVEAFPSRVEQTFDNESDIPGLKDIVLGS